MAIPSTARRKTSHQRKSRISSGEEDEDDQSAIEETGRTNERTPLKTKSKENQNTESLGACLSSVCFSEVDKNLLNGIQAIENNCETPFSTHSFLEDNSDTHTPNNEVLAFKQA